MKLYVAGPMTGYPEHNFPAFQAAAAQLREAGYEVVSPAEQHYNEDLTQPWAWYLKQDIPVMLGCDGVALLPGWGKSRGAKLEQTVADAVGMKCWPVEGWLGYLDLVTLS